MSEPPPAASRRGVLVLGLGLVGVSVAGCELSDLDPREPLPAPDPDGAAAGTSPPDPDSDVALVAEVVAAMAALRARVDAVRRRHRGLRQELAPLAQAHRRHLDVLDPAGEQAPGDAAPVATTPRTARDRRQLVRAERTLLLEVSRAAEQADAGQVAKLLGSISASLAQHVSILEAER